MSVEGRLQSDTYEKNGQKIYSMNVVVQTLEFVESKEINEQYAQKAMAAQKDNSNNANTVEKDDFLTPDSEDYGKLPFLPFERPF